MEELLRKDREEEWEKGLSNKELKKMKNEKTFYFNSKIASDYEDRKEKYIKKIQEEIKEKAKEEMK